MNEFVYGKDISGIFNKTTTEKTFSAIIVVIFLKDSLKTFLESF